jgi:MerR family transcriptional regulator/heat shock protein HspR
MMVIDNDRPFFPISQAAQLIGVTPDRIRTYEEETLIKPYRDKKGKRLFSQNDIKYLICVRKFVREYGLSIKALVILFDFTTCYNLMKKVGNGQECKTCYLAKGKKNKE